MNDKEIKISKEAKKYIKSKSKSIIDKFADTKSYPSDKNPVSVFMAGSPGAGKTEFSKELIVKLGRNAVRIDADEIRNILPQYTGSNSNIVQGASALGVEKLHDSVLKNNQNFVLDGTLADRDKAISNINRSIKKGREIELFYIYQDPKVAWDFTKEREIKEGRNVPRDIFINSFISARENVNEVKRIFEARVDLTLVIKDYQNNTRNVYVNIDNLDKYMDYIYTESELEKILL